MTGERLLRLKKIGHDSYTAVKIVAHLVQITDKLKQLGAVNQNHMNTMKSSIQVHRYDYTRAVPTVSAKASARPVNLQQTFTDGQTQPKKLRADVKDTLLDRQHQYRAL